ncbi:MAG: AI-2E family transporter [Candidatus Levybacteria bacterium]|nr:AI-2E family transporter [Candidatus Levybacteria bacterium]
MTIRVRAAFFIFLALFSLWFLYIERAILAPFVLGIIFAYIFNPVINFFYRYIKLPRTFSIVVIYLVIVSLVIFLGIVLTRQITNESSELINFIDKLPQNTENQISTLPFLIKPIAQDALSFLEKPNPISSVSVFNFFPKAISSIIGLFIFLFSGFYFLKDGRTIFKRLINLAPSSYKNDLEFLSSRINNVLGSYLRGQIFMVFLVSLALYIALAIVGVKFALILAIFSGFAEIVPIIGPIFAGAVGALVALLSNNLSFGLNNLQGAIVVIIIYFVVRQIQDYFIAPGIMGRIVRLHPLIILFSVLAGEHIWGILGVILAVPIAGIVRILLEFSIAKINKEKS